MKQLPGTVMFIFQPAEEGQHCAPVGQELGRQLMMRARSSSACARLRW